MIALLWAKVWKWVVAAAALAGGLISLWLYGRAAGEKKGAVEAQKANENAANAEAATQVAQDETKTVETRNAIDAADDKLPDAPAQKVADADPATALGKLRDEGFVRPPDAK